MPLKMHIIVHHYRDYFEQSGETLLKYTDEFTESMHSQLRQFEESHHYKNLKFECESHAEVQNKSIVHINREQKWVVLFFFLQVRLWRSTLIYSLWKVDKKFGQGPPPPHLDKIQKNSYFFRETFP